MIYNTLGVVIRKTDFREYDRMLTIYTDKFGKIKIIARGVRKSKAKLKSLTELFYLCDFWIFLRKMSFYGVLTGGVIIDSFSNMRYNIKSFYEASYICDVLDALTPERQPNIKKFNLIKEKLSLLDKDILNQTEDFVKNLLEISGFGVRKNYPIEEQLKEHLSYPLKSRKYDDTIIR